MHEVDLIGRGLLAVLSERAGTTARRTAEHLALTLAAVLLAALVAIPLGIAITGRVRLRQVALGAAGVVQTIPSLALLAFMIPLLGLDVRAAIAALFPYAVLPILRNTYTGIAGVEPALIDAARGIGMRPRQILTRGSCRWPSGRSWRASAPPRSSASASRRCAAFIGAGGLGQPIVEGLYLNDTGLNPAGCRAGGGSGDPGRPGARMPRGRRLRAPPAARRGSGRDVRSETLQAASLTA